MHQLGERLDGLHRCGTIDVTGGDGLLRVGQAAAKAPDERAQVPAGQRGLVPAPNLLAVCILAAELAQSFAPLLHRLGYGHAGRFQHRLVVEHDLAVGVQRQRIIMTVDDRGGHRTGKQRSADCVKVLHFLVERGQDAHLLEFRQPRDVAARYIGQRARFRTDKHLVVQLRPLMGDGVDFDARIFRLKGGDQHVHQRRVLRRLSAVMVPELEGDVLRKRAGAQQHQAGDDRHEGFCTHGFSSF